jgi:hypothetical protein
MKAQNFKNYYTPSSFIVNLLYQEGHKQSHRCCWRYCKADILLLGGLSEYPGETFSKPELHRTDITGGLFVVLRH